MTSNGNDLLKPQGPDSEAWAYRRARRQVRALRGWYVHAMAFLCVNAFVWLRFVYAPFDDMSRFHRHGAPLNMTLFWGLALVIHGVVVWSRLSNYGRQWEERKVREFMNRP